MNKVNYELTTTNRVTEDYRVLVPCDWDMHSVIAVLAIVCVIVQLVK